MSEPTTARFFLRAATAQDHERVDAAFGDFDLADRADYARFLTAQAAAFLPTEAAIERAGPLAVVPDWPERRRSALLLNDLAALGIAPPEGEALGALESPTEVLGAIYVLEGSRLGGAMLARSIPDGYPRRFMTASDPVRWRGLISIMDRCLISDEQRAAATTAARRVFALFERGASRQKG